MEGHCPVTRMKNTLNRSVWLVFVCLCACLSLSLCLSLSPILGRIVIVKTLLSLSFLVLIVIMGTYIFFLARSDCDYRNTWSLPWSHRTYENITVTLPPSLCPPSPHQRRGGTYWFQCRSRWCWRWRRRDRFVPTISL